VFVFHLAKARMDIDIKNPMYGMSAIIDNAGFCPAFSCIFHSGTTIKTATAIRYITIYDFMRQMPFSPISFGGFPSFRISDITFIVLMIAKDDQKNSLMKISSLLSFHHWPESALQLKQMVIYYHPSI